MVKLNQQQIQELLIIITDIKSLCNDYNIRLKRQQNSIDLEQGFIPNVNTKLLLLQRRIAEYKSVQTGIISSRNTH